jgi:hypothetical protein
LKILRGTDINRTALCSFDYTTSTLYREAIVRMPTGAVEKMSRVSRVNFGFAKMEEQRPVHNDAEP